MMRTMMMMIVVHDEYACYENNQSDHHQGEVLMGHYGTLQKNQLGQNVSAIAFVILPIPNSYHLKLRPPVNE